MPTELENRIELLLLSYTLAQLLERFDIEESFVIELLMEHGHLDEEEIMDV